MKVLLATTQFWPDVGGVPRLLATLCQTRPERVSLQILSIRNHPIGWRGQYDLPIKWVEPRSANGITSVAYFFQLWRDVRNTKPDIIFSGIGFPTAILAAAVSWLTKVPLAVYTYSEDLTIQGSLKRSLLGWALNRAEVIFTLADFGRRQLLPLGVTHPTIYLMPPGIDTLPYLAEAASTLAARPFTLLTVARLVLRKGQDTVIRALPRLQKSIPGIQYLIVGSGPDEQPLRELAQRLGVENNVQFIGPVPDADLPGIYQNCDVFVMPSRVSMDGSEVEGFGIAYLEAGATAKPVIGGRNGGVEAAILDGVTGFLIDPSDVTELAERIEQLACHHDLALQMGKAARARVLAEFSAANFGTKVFTILEELISRNPKVAG